MYNLFNTINYEKHFGAFDVQFTSKISCIKLNELENIFPVHHNSITNENIFIKMLL